MEFENYNWLYYISFITILCNCIVTTLINLIVYCNLNDIKQLI